MSSASLCFLATSLLFLSATPTLCQSTASSKRGLVYVTPSQPSDDDAWTPPSTDLTWYYNYVSTPSSPLATSASHLQFVPMLWGSPSSPTATDTTFLDSVVSQVQSGSNISHALAYNEPDGSSSTGGSNLPTDAAANTWLQNIKPLRDTHGLKVGLPAVTGSPSGISWLSNFNTSCLRLDPAGCEADFIPIHWYGSFEGLASHMGQLRALYPTIPMWVTEYALADASLDETQSFYNMSAEYLDRTDYVERYSYFGAFRSDKSNVGGNAAFLTQDGELTDIGSWYLGGTATGNVPKGAASARRDGSVALVVGVVAVLTFCNWPL
jgi:Glycosyl hydrolase catalytic core